MQAARALTLSSTYLRHSHSRTTRVLTAISNNSRWRGRHQSFSAVPVSVQSEIEQPQRRPKKRITKDERRSLVKAFVEKYRASNAGKFPNPTETQKQVGGSYYTIKNIIQELEYNNKQATTITAEKDETLLEELLPSPEAGDAPRSNEGADLTDCTYLGGTNETQTVIISNMDIDESASNNSQAKEENLTSIEISSSEAASNSSEVKAETLSSIEISSSEAASNSSEVKAETLSSIEISVSEATINSSEVKAEALRSVEISVSEATINSSEVKAETLSPIEASIDESTSDKAETLSSVETSHAESISDLQNLGIPSNSDKTHTHQINPENKEMSHLCTEEPRNSKEAATSGYSLDLDKSKVGMENREEATEPEKLALSKGIYEESEENQPLDRLTVWGSLRSFADGIVKLWRKM